MTKSTVWWFDIAAIPVLSFKDEGWAYALLSDTGMGGPLRVFLTTPGANAPSQSISFDATGKLAAAELGPQPGDARQGGATREEREQSMATWPQRHKMYRPGSEEFKSFWQKLADQALDAIRRQVSK